MDENKKEKNVRKKQKETRYVSAWKVILKSVILTAVSGLILFAAMLAVFFGKLSNNMIEQVNVLEKSVVETLKTSERVWNGTEQTYNGILLFLRHYQETTECSDSEMLEYGRAHNPSINFYVLSPDKEAENGADFYRGYTYDWDYIQQMLEGEADQSPAFFADEKDYLGFLRLGKDRLLCITIPRDADALMAEVITTRQAIGSVRQNSRTRNDDISRGFIRSSETGDILTEDQYYSSDSGDTEKFTSLPTIAGVIVNRSETQYRFDVGRVEDEYFFTVSRYNEELKGDVYYCLRPIAEMQSDKSMTLFVQVVFFALLLMFGLFVLYLKQYTALYPEDSTYSRDIIRNRVLILLIISAIALGGTSYYAQTLFSLAISVFDDTDTLNAIEDSYDQKQTRMENINVVFRDRYTSVLACLADYAGENPEAVSAEELKKLSEFFGLQYVMVYDTDGREILSSNHIRNYAFPQNPEDPAYALNDLKYGVKSVYIPPEKSMLAEYEGSARFAANVYSSDNEPAGYLEFGVYPNILYAVSENAYLSSVLRSTMLKEGYRYIAADAENLTVIDASVSGCIGKTLTDIGFTEDSLKTGYFGKQLVGGETCYVSTVLLDSSIIFLLHPESQVYYSRLPYTSAAVILFLLSSCILLFGMREKRRKYKRVVFFSQKEEQRIKTHNENETDAAVHEENPKTVSGWRKKLDDLAFRWMYMEPEKKMTYAFTILMELTAVVLLVSAAGQGLPGADNSLLARIISGRWVKGVNVFSLTANVMVVIITIVIVTVVRWILHLIGQIVDAKGDTIVRLLKSAASYTAIISASYICLVNIGIDPPALAASAGLIGVGIGIGARDLITDIIAGLFIIFEGTLQVGDIIEVAGYEGIVQEIGIRTTIVRGWDFNQKIINNRNMSNILNKSADNTYSVYGFSVPYTISPGELAEGFKEKFRNYAGIHPEVISAPYFSCVRQKISGMIECHVVAEISDFSRSAMENVLMRDIEEVLEKKGIKAVWIIIPSSLR